jgi:hypothetical protein
MNDARFINADLKVGNRRRPIHEVNAAGVSRPQYVKASNAVARNAVETIVSALQWKAYHFDELLLAAGQMLTQAQQSNAMFAKRIHTDGHWPTIGPERLVALELNFAMVSIA